MPKFHRTVSVPLFLAGFASLIGGAARSQQAPQAVADQLEEIVVTAQKRTENLKDVPSNVSVLGGDQLLEHNVAGVEDISRTIPSVSFNAGGSGIGVGTGETNVEIRGVSSSSGAATVGVYFDDASVTVDNKNGIGAPSPMVFDLNRIEVLRGPQGTLFGASSEGGTVRYIFNPAVINERSAEVGADVSHTKHGGFNYMTTAVANLPLAKDTAALRIDVGYASQSGWIDNYSLDGALLKSGVNSNQTTFFRAAGNIQASHALNLKPQIIYQQVHSDDSSVFYLHDVAYYQANPGAVPPPLATDGLYRQHKEVAEPSRDTLILPSLTATYDFGPGDLTSVTSYSYRPYDRITDGTTINSYIIAVDFLGRPPTDRVIATLPSSINQPVDYHTFSQELRVSSHDADDAVFKWVAGAYFSDQMAAFKNYNVVPGLSATFQSVYGYGINSAQSPIGYPSMPNLYAGDYVYTEDGSYRTREYALFGQGTYTIASRLHGTVGLRATSAEVNTDVTQGGLFAVGNMAPFAKSDHFNSVTPKFSVVYDLNTTSTVYTTLAKGFRLGGELYTPLPTGPTNICAGDETSLGLTTNATSSYNSDSLWSYEVGSKGRALGNSLSFDVAGYLLNWKNLQQAIYLPTCGYYDTVNIGDARSYGVEVELRYRPKEISGMTVGITGGANRATVTSSNNPLAARPGQNVLFSPRWTATASIDYHHPVTARVDGFLSWDYDFTGPSNGSYQSDNPNFQNPKYAVMNLTVGARFDDWEVAAYVRNLLDDQTIIQSPTINALVEGYALQPLTIGMRVQKTF